MSVFLSKRGAMMKTKRSLHLPMSEELYQKLRLHAENMGFDSAQAYIRFVATAETSSKGLTVGRYSFPDLTSTKAQALRYMELLLIIHKEDFPTMEQAIFWLALQIKQDSLYRHLKKVLAVDK